MWQQVDRRSIGDGQQSLILTLLFFFVIGIFLVVNPIVPGSVVVNPIVCPIVCPIVQSIWDLDVDALVTFLDIEQVNSICKDMPIGVSYSDFCKVAPVLVARFFKSVD
jgi:hypothetical protein